MDTIIDWFRGLSRAAQYFILIAVCVFTPVVGIAFSLIFGGIGAAFSVIGFVLGFVNWGVAFAILCGYGIYRVYVAFNKDDDDATQDDDDSWLNRY